MVLPVSAPLPERIGRYRIEGKLGEGGMGVVYAARDERLDRPVALKTIRGDSDETARKRLWREARAAAGVSHPNICQLYEIEETDDGLVLAMELLAGESLAARLGRGPLSGADAAASRCRPSTRSRPCTARGFVHRDLKPSNLFLTPHGVKLLDFGLARPMADGAVGRHRDAADAGRGDRRHAELHGPRAGARRAARRPQPTCSRWRRCSSRCCRGSVAFAGATMVDVLHAVLHEQPPALSGGAAVAGLDRVIHRALQKQAADRYESAAAMAAAIRDVVAARDSSEMSAPRRPADDPADRPAVPRPAAGRRDRLPGLQPARCHHHVADRHPQPAGAIERGGGAVRPAGPGPAQAGRRRRRRRGADGHDPARRQPAAGHRAAGRGAGRHGGVVARVAAPAAGRVRAAGRAGRRHRRVAVAVARRSGQPRRPAATCRATPRPTSCTCAATSWPGTGTASPRPATSISGAWRSTRSSRRRGPGWAAASA